MVLVNRLAGDRRRLVVVTGDKKNQEYKIFKTFTSRHICIKAGRWRAIPLVRKLSIGIPNYDYGSTNHTCSMTLNLDFLLVVDDEHRKMRDVPARSQMGTRRERCQEFSDFSYCPSIETSVGAILLGTMT